MPFQFLLVLLIHDTAVADILMYIWIEGRKRILTEYFLSEPNQCVYCTNPRWNFCAEHSPLESGTSKLLEDKIGTRLWLNGIEWVYLISCCEAIANFLETHGTCGLQLKSQFKTLFFIDPSFASRIEIPYVTQVHLKPTMKHCSCVKTCMLEAVCADVYITLLIVYPVAFINDAHSSVQSLP